MVHLISIIIVDKAVHLFSFILKLEIFSKNAHKYESIEVLMHSEINCLTSIRVLKIIIYPVSQYNIVDKHCYLIYATPGQNILDLVNCTIL